MAAKPKPNTGKSGNKRSTKSSKSDSSSRVKKSSSIKSAAKPTQHKPKPTIASAKKKKKKPPHLRYTEEELKVPQLNGIRPAGVQKIPNKKKGKHFVDDGEGMRTILAMVMAEKEGNIESKMMRARQMEEIREARRSEAEKRAEGKKAGLEERKDKIRQSKKKGRRRGDIDGAVNGRQDGGVEEMLDQARKPRKKVSFG